MGFGVGDLLAGKYRVERIIGRGGMGVVLAARHVDLGELFAVKLVEGIDRSGGERLLREARASARLRGEHVVRLHDVGWLAEKTPFLVLELVRGESVAAELRARGPFSAEATALVLSHACLALAEAHASALVHRDVKPSNLLATKRPDGSRIIKLLDFGIAKLSDRADDHRITGDSATLGSPAYMSPEQIRDAHTVDARTDVWALGVLAQELFTGKPPFAAFTTSGVLASIVADDPAPLPDGTPPALRAMIAGCLVKEADQRLASVADVADAIAPLLAEGSALAQRVRATLASSGAPDQLVEPDPPRFAGTTHDEPTYDPTELSADATGPAPGPPAVEGREASELATGTASRTASHSRRPVSRPASPWIIPAIALPLAAALALLASSRGSSTDANGRGPIAAGTTAPPIASAALAASVAGAQSTPLDAAPAPAPVVSAPVESAHPLPPTPTAKARTGTPTPARAGRPAAPIPPAPQPDDLDRFGGRK